MKLVKIIATIAVSGAIAYACNSNIEEGTRLAESTGAEETQYDALDSSPKVSYKSLDGELTRDQINTWVSKHREENGSSSNFRYAYIPNDFLNEKARANYARVGLAKAMNSVSIDADEIICPEDISDGHGVVFAIDLNKHWGESASRKWQITASASYQSATGATPVLDLRRFDANTPVRADRLAYNLLHGGVYNRLIETPAYASILKRDIEAGSVTHRMAVSDAITYSPRFAQRRQLPGGRAYWESFDDFDSDDRRLVWTNRKRNNPVPSFRRDGMLADMGDVASETWFHMKNGLPAWYIWGNANQRRVRAEQIFVRDTFNHKDRYLLTGFCQFCHIAGVQGSPSDMAYAIERGVFSGRALEVAKETWSTNEDLGKVYRADREVIRKALQKMTLCMSDGDKLFNRDIIYSSGRDQIETTFLLISNISGHPGKGSTNGYRRRVFVRDMTPK